jgi:penicillin-binding protein 1A
VLLVLTLAGAVGTGTFVAGLLSAPIDLAVVPPPTATLLLAADGRQFATLLPPERRENVGSQDIPQVMRDAIISAEDERFLSHSGVDFLATLRAAFRDLTGSGVQQGGSTLTQQYVKNAYVGNERTALRKIREAALAIRLERKLSKQEILTDYLNAVYLGNGLYGVQAASKYYYGVPVKDLDLDPRTGRRDPLLALARASMLAGIAPAPSAWNPVKDFTTARVRQQYTLNRMVVGRFATPQQASDAYQLDVHPMRVPAEQAPTIAPEFADYVKARVDKALDEDQVNRGGLRVRTTLDLDLQQAFNEALQEVLPDAKDPQAAIVAVDYRTGDIKAMATLRRVPAVVNKQTGKVVTPAVNGYQRFGYNLATVSERSSGSTIKPFTLAVALQQGMSLSTTRYAPNHLCVPNPGGTPNPYCFSNSDVSESGTFTLRRALADSVNTVYLPLAKDVGRGKVAALAQAAGLAGTIKPGNLSFGIGAGVEITPLSEAVAYGTFANDGVHVAPRPFSEIRIGASGTDPGEVVVTRPPASGARVMSASVAGDVVKAMTDVVQHGTGRAARQPFPVFGKTGTTNDSTDAWFTGCIPDQRICIATWMGYDRSSCALGDPDLKIVGPCGGMKNLHGFRQVYGGTLPAKIFATAQQDLRRIQAERAALLSGKPLPTATPTRARPRPTASATPSPTPRPTPRPTPAATTPAPAPSPTGLPIPVPTGPAPSSPGAPAPP